MFPRHIIKHHLVFRRQATIAPGKGIDALFSDIFLAFSFSLFMELMKYINTDQVTPVIKSKIRTQSKGQNL